MSEYIVTGNKEIEFLYPVDSTDNKTGISDKQGSLSILIQAPFIAPV